jgi:hypothetical protein
LPSQQRVRITSPQWDGQRTTITTQCDVGVGSSSGGITLAGSFRSVGAIGGMGAFGAASGDAQTGQVRVPAGLSEPQNAQMMEWDMRCWG